MDKTAAPTRSAASTPIGELYHATTSAFEEGRILTDPADAMYAEVTKLLNAERPAGAPSRSNCFFASDNLGFAVEYSMAQQDKRAPKPIFVYTVEIEEPWRAPMALINAIRKGLQQKRDVRALVREYWHPAEKWKCFEVFGPVMKIIRVISNPSSSYVDYLNYNPGDTSRADGLYAKCPPDQP